MEAGEKITDLTFLSNFAAGDTTRMKKYIGMFLQIAPQQMDKIKAALAASDWDTIRANAHSLKPQITYMGISGGEELIKKIENDAASRANLAELPGIISRMDDLCKKAMGELELFMKQ
jgi:HPt (histidine-containing phosphotransfer) domain-containing protein